MTPMRRQQRRFALVSLAPAFVLFTLFVAYPAAQGFYFALTRWSGLTDPVYIGLENFENLAKSIVSEDSGASARMFRTAMANNLILMFVPAILILTIALFFASTMRSRIRGAGLFRVTFFFPNILSAVAVSILWMLLYSTSGFGVFNSVLGSFNEFLLEWGLREDPLVAVPFPFTDSTILAYSLIPMMVWTATGFYMLLFLAAMQSIPETLYEAARVDGASPISQFWHITLPMIRDTIVTGVVFLFIAGLKIFDQVWVIEQQQPRPASHTMATLMYAKIFNEYQVGYGTAIAVVLFLCVLAFTLLTIRFYRKEALEY